MPRSERLSDSAMKIALSMVHRIFADWDCQRHCVGITVFFTTNGGGCSAPLPHLTARARRGKPRLYGSVILN